MNDVILVFSPCPALPPTLQRPPRRAAALPPPFPVILALGRLLAHLDLTPTLTLMTRIELRGSERRPQVRGKSVAVLDVLRIARRCSTLEEVMELRPSLDELDVRACLAYDLKVRGLREG